MSMCKVCFKEFTNHGVSLLKKNSCICQKCFNEFNPIFKSSKIDGKHLLVLYEYNETMRNNLFKLKGCFDYELKDVFLDKFIFELKMRYRGYVIVTVPSSKEDDELRGFNHVEEIFKSLNLPIFKVLEKKYKFKQSELSKIEREKIKDRITIKNKEVLTGKKVLIVDDVITTGSSIKASIKLVSEANPKCIKTLVLAQKLENKKYKISKIRSKIATLFSKIES